MPNKKVPYQQLILQENNFLQIFGLKIKQLRTSKGWSQEKLGYEANLDRTYIGGIERGERNISLLKTKQNCRCFKRRDERLILRRKLCIIHNSLQESKII